MCNLQKKTYHKVTKTKRSLKYIYYMLNKIKTNVIKRIQNTFK